MVLDDFDFPQFCRNILDECPNTKVIITCKESIHQTELIVEVEGLVDPKQDAWNLFEQYFAKPIKQD